MKNSFYSFKDCKLLFYYEECTSLPSQSTTINTGNQLNTIIRERDFIKFTGQSAESTQYIHFTLSSRTKKDFSELAYFLFIMYINLNTTITNIITWAENARSLFCLSHCEGRHGGGGVKCDKLGFSVHLKLGQNPARSNIS